jgi:hypothetical protein
MTRDQAIAWRYERAGSKSINEAMVMRCAERGDGCKVVSYGTTHVAEHPKLPPNAIVMANYATCAAEPCANHAPSKRFSWLMYVIPDDIVRHAAGSSAFAIDELRKYLPRAHLEYRP